MALTTLSYLGLKIWDLVPDEIKESESLNGFKFKIERLKTSLKDVHAEYAKYTLGKQGL